MDGEVQLLALCASTGHILADAPRTPHHPIDGGEVRARAKSRPSCYHLPREGHGTPESSGMREADELSRVIGDIYDASLDPGLWPNAIESVCGYVGAASASLHSQDSISRATDALFWWGRASDAPHYFQIYLEKYGKINPIFPGVIFFDVELPIAVPDVISCEEFVQTRFFREWLAPQMPDGRPVFKPG
jgi:hypothetical protein